VPDELDVHLILDNYATHKSPPIQRWLLRHPRFHLHFTPKGASWLNRVMERWFAELTHQGPASQRTPLRPAAEGGYPALARHLERESRPLRPDEDG